jgi:hypothetical protein
VVYWIWVPETRQVPLEELGAIFGDEDEVKVYSSELAVDSEGQVVVEDHGAAAQSKNNAAVTEKERV